MNNDISERIVDHLFTTRAVEVCNYGDPFFYTSGKIGPYYINTHYLYGSKDDAQRLLDEMAKHDERVELIKYLSLDIQKQMESDEIYKDIVQILTDLTKEIEFDIISGGERRDFFFSIPVALILGKSHLSIFKDGEIFLSQPDFTSSRKEGDFDITGSKVLHIADLVTEASSYIRGWLPAINRTKALINNTISVVDRDQGGNQILSDSGVDLISAVKISSDFFELAQNKGYISADQHLMIKAFIKDPDRFMIDFLSQDPGFLERKIKAGGKLKERALRCIEKGYDLTEK